MKQVVFYKWHRDITSYYDKNNINCGNIKSIEELCNGLVNVTYNNGVIDLWEYNLYTKDWELTKTIDNRY
jgi:hypothetical protein